MAVLSSCAVSLIQYAGESLQSLVSATHILQHGLGADIVPSPSGGSPVEAAFADSMQQAIAAAEQAEGSLGPDIRGRRLSQDVRDFYEAARASARTVPAGSAAADSLDNQQRQRYQALHDYWHQYPSLTHNRDMWSTFLARNGMPPNTPHDSAVTVAENALRSTLESGVPNPEWSSRAQELRAAYIEERSHSVRVRTIAAADYRPRVSPCSSPADKTTGKKSPAVARMNRSLEDFWPLESKRLGEEGRVMVSLRVSATGCAVAVAISGSSGSEMLDGAVMQFYETIDFTPAEIDGKAAESTLVCRHDRRPPSSDVPKSERSDAEAKGRSVCGVGVGRKNYLIALGKAAAENIVIDEVLPEIHRRR